MGSRTSVLATWRAARQRVRLLLILGLMTLWLTSGCDLGSSGSGSVGTVLPEQPSEEGSETEEGREPEADQGQDQDPGQNGDAASAVLPLHVTLADADLDELYRRDPQSDDRLDATARVGEGDELPIEIRFRGSSSRFLPKKSFNIRFEEGQPFLFGSARMNANAMYTDPAMMRERLAMGMFHALERPASRTAYFDIWLNGVYEGLYVHIERVDEDLLANAGLNPEGTLVRDQLRDLREEVGRRSTFGYPLSGEGDEGAQEAFLAEAFDSRGEPDWGALRELVAWVETAESGAEFAAEFERRFHLETFVDWLAIHWLIGDVDAFGDDYWLYYDHHDPEAARWYIIPWDKDLSFGSHFRQGHFTANDFFAYEYPLRGGWDNELLELFLATEPLRARLDERLEELMGLFDRAYFEREIETYAAMVKESLERSPDDPDSFERHPANHHGEPGYHALHTESLLDFIELRYQFMRRALEPVEGAVYAAEVDLRERVPGDVLLLTDANGWTVARLELLSVPETAGELRATVREDDTVGGIDRAWVFDNASSGFDALLTLYYRNDVDSDFTVGGNWYTGGVVPIGEQRELFMMRREGNRLAPEPDSEVNPYSNKVTAPVRFDNVTEQEWLITFPQ